MRRLAAILVAVATLPLMGAAPDAPVHHAQTTIPASAAPAGLRGPQATVNGAPAAPVAVPPPLLATTETASADHGQCRAACARPYYFCLAGDAPESCPDAWSRCVAGCDAP